MTSADPLAGWASRTRLHDEKGRLLLAFTVATDTRGGRPCADGVWRPGDVTVGRAVEAALGSFSGWALSTADRELAEALLAAASLTLRHAHLLSHDLSALPPTPRGSALAVEPLDGDDVARNAERLGEIALAAYAAGHPDHSHDVTAQAVDEIAAIGRGELLGPLLTQSRLARYQGAIVGACLVVDREGQAPQGGPWVIELFRDPAAEVRGIGAALLTAVLSAASETGLASMSLAVSEGNVPALRLYERLGFVEAEQSWTLALP